MILPDLLQSNLKLVFCGTAASAISAKHHAYYANPTNYFWRALYTINLTPQQLAPHEFPELLRYGIGLTDVAKHALGNDSDLSRSDYDAKSLHQKIEEYQPKILAFTSKKGASVCLNTSTSNLSYGQQSTTISQTQLWVLPSPSGSARRYWDINVWQSLADAIGNMPKSDC